MFSQNVIYMYYLSCGLVWFSEQIIVAQFHSDSKLYTLREGIARKIRFYYIFNKYNKACLYIYFNVD